MWVFEAWLCGWLCTYVLGQMKPMAQRCGACNLSRLPTHSEICSEKSDKIIMLRLFRNCKGISKVKINFYLQFSPYFCSPTFFQKTVLVSYEFFEIGIPVQSYFCDQRHFGNFFFELWDGILLQRWRILVISQVARKQLLAKPVVFRKCNYSSRNAFQSAQNWSLPWSLWSTTWF